MKSQLAPPAKDYVLNIHRDSNPFLCDGPANWCPTPLLAESNSNTNAENPRLPPRTVSKSFLRNRDASTETWLTDDQCVFEQKRRDLDSPSVSIESPERGPNTNTKDLLGEAISDDLNWRPLTPE